MKEIITTMTQRGQVTVPAEVRRLLGLRPRDKVAFGIEDGKVQLTPARFTLESAFGSVRPATKTAEFKTISRAARDEKAKEEIRKLGPS